MAKSIKLSNDTYWDSKGVVHNNEILNDILGKFPFKYYGEIWTGVDINKYKKNGFISLGIPTDGTKHQNLPDNNAGTLVIFGHSQWGFQLFVAYPKDSGLYFRNFFSNDWGSWKKIV